MKKLILLFAAAALTISFVSAAPKLTLTKQKNRACVIDGKITTADAWTATWIPIALDKKNADGSPANTTSDASGEFQICYDDWCLYVIAKSNDPTAGDTLFDVGNNYQNDCFEVFVGLDTTATANAGNYKLGDFQFRMAGWDAAYPYRFDVGTGSPSPTGAASKDTFVKDPNMQIKQDMDASSYTEEWAIPWRKMMVHMDTSKTQWNPTMIKFDIQNADNTPGGTATTGARTQQMFWNNASDNQWHNTTTFGLIALAQAVDTSAHASIQTADVKTLNAFVNNGLLIIDNINSNATVNITNLIGQNVLQANYKGGINVSSLKSGIYVVRAGTMASKIYIK